MGRVANKSMENLSYTGCIRYYLFSATSLEGSILYAMQTFQNSCNFLNEFKFGMFTGNAS